MDMHLLSLGEPNRLPFLIIETNICLTKRESWFNRPMELKDTDQSEVELRAEELVKDGWLRQNVVEHFDQILRQSQDLGWRSVSGILSKVLRDPQLHSKQRRLLSDTLYDLIRKLRRLKAISGLKTPSAEQFYGLWLLDHYLKQASMTNGQAAKTLRREAESLGFLWQPLIDRWQNLEQSMQQIKDSELAVDVLADGFSYPSWQVRLLVEQYGLLEAKQILEGQNQRAPLSIRANVLKGSRDLLSETLQNLGIPNHATELSPWGLILKTRTNVYSLPTFQEGMFELQDEGSQLIAELVAPPPSSVVIDACAGAGGKTLALGAWMHNRGRLYAVDIDAKKLMELKKRTRRAGLSNVQVLKMPDDESTVTNAAHRVLCDVPCSGLGVLRRHPEARWAIQKNEIQELTRKQRAILEQASQWVKKGGRLIYSTCTLLAEENEAMVQEFLKNHAEFVLMPVKEIWGAERAKQVGDGTFLKLLPVAPESPDGFFAAVLRKIT